MNWNSEFRIKECECGMVIGLFWVERALSKSGVRATLDSPFFRPLRLFGTSRHREGRYCMTVPGSYCTSWLLLLASQFDHQSQHAECIVAQPNGIVKVQRVNNNLLIGKRNSDKKQVTKACRNSSSCELWSAKVERRVLSLVTCTAHKKRTFSANPGFHTQPKLNSNQT